MTSATNQTYYQILGVQNTASAEDIKSAYKKQARLQHPDKVNQDSQTAEKANAVFRLLKEAMKLR